MIVVAGILALAESTSCHYDVTSCPTSSRSCPSHTVLIVAISSLRQSQQNLMNQLGIRFTLVAILYSLVLQATESWVGPGNEARFYIYG